MDRHLSPHGRKQRLRTDRITSAFLAFLAVCSAPGPAAAESADSSRLMAVDKSNTICQAHVSNDLGADYIRYPICLETRWNAASATSGGERPATTRSASGIYADSKDSSGSVTVPVPDTASSESSKSKESGSSGSGDDADVESPLDNSNFLSFEEWKNQNLAKAGQSAETMRRHRQDKGQQARRRHTRSPQMNDPLDGLGEESEIDLEFGGFSTDESGVASWERKDDGMASPDNIDSIAAPGGAVVGGKEDKHPSQPIFELDGQDAENMPRKGIGRRKHAGTTCKERFNYASFDCAATVLKTNPQCTGSSAVLNENKDSYMLNECRAKDKFLIMELCDDILVDTVVLANYEFFSSIFRSFRVSVSDRYPIKADKWRVLGTYEAANARQVQAFAVENPLIWARYLKIDFLSHYGNEFYCPVSLVRVHGTTMMEEYKNDGEAARADEEEDANAQEEAEQQRQQEEQQQQEQKQVDVVVHPDVSIPEVVINDQMVPLSNLSDHELDELRCFVERNETESILLGLVSSKMCAIQERAAHIASQPVTATRVKDEAAAPASGSITSTNTPEQIRSVSSTRTPTASDREETRRTSTGSSIAANGSHTEPTRMNSATYSPSPASPPPNPSTQESFFKSVNKRLQMLESNSTLSLLYIEEQSRILRDAFNKVEKRQLAKTSTFLENLNSTVLQELKEFRQQYDHLWHSVFIEFEQQRQQYHREVYSVATQLGVLADELVFQKRVAVIQSIFVLVCFGLVLFSRSSGTPYFEFPRNIVTRTRSFRSSSVTYDSPAPSASPSPPPMSRMGSSILSRSEADDDHLHHNHSRHHRSPSEQTDYEVGNPTFTYSPPTPTSRTTTPERTRKLRFSPDPQSGLAVSATGSPATMSDPELSLRKRPIKSVEVKHESESDAEQAEGDSFT
ncbi:Galactose-binding domain-like [Trichophyton interdigitale]|uniref:Galactose-binding domain-like n=1 Tax=Trichophyton interdigitale TaxID=101480 RepID=A0A9P4YNX8_9EURO|nr:Galactose-binding domain-like [Trichophyton interdigitale]KAF3901010.1 Galactose-binding domain-like [Trichophyton interdigitale]KAG8208652.1 Galactose-binding domain-like [Trichophyton interdigitale]